MKTNLHIIWAFMLLCLLPACQKQQPALAIEGNTSYTLESARVELPVRLNRSDWEYACEASWIEFKGREGNKASFVVTENTTVTERSAAITFTAGGTSATVSVTQAGKQQDPFIIFTVTGNDAVPTDGATLSAEISSYPETWEAEVTAGADFITLSPAGNTLSITVASNPDDKVREGRIRLYTPSKAAYLSYNDIPVRQQLREITYDLTDLSEGGTSNSYLISHKGPYCFNATIRGNGKTVTGLAAPAALSPAGAKLVWQSARGMISSVSLQEGKIRFTAERINGNAVIAATDAAGNVIWSWHIWYPAEEPTVLRADSGDQVMSMNLGAMKSTPSGVDALGLLYQWGRKDPFPGSPVANKGSVITQNTPVYDMDGKTVKIGSTSMYSLSDNTLAYSIAHPEVCISNNQQYATSRDWLKPAESNDALWGNPDGNAKTGSNYNKTGSKTYYDPCPAGWRVPPLRTFHSFTPTGGYHWVFEEFNVADINGSGAIDLGDWSDGWYIYLDKAAGVYSYFPAATRYDGQYAMLMGSMVGLWGNYWFNTPGEAGDTLVPYGARAVSFSIKDYNGTDLVTMSAMSTGSRADAYSVRCIKE